MISLLIVSHCHEIAEGVKELAAQMAQGELRIGAVGGIVDEAGKPILGTDASQILAALEELWTPDGVLILVDLGSAVLGAEMALELLPEEKRSGCLISNAPLVEGAVVAAVEASFGRSLAEVNRAAEEACQFPKVPR